MGLLFWRKSKKGGPSGDGKRLATLSSSPKKTFVTGIQCLYDSENCFIDIVFIHGLTGDRVKTWTVKDDASSTPWPQSLLPIEIPDARILTFGYDAYVVDWTGVVSQNRIADHASNLLTSLSTYRDRDETNERPIIFICHSLGGLVCKDALVVSNQSPEPHLKCILESTRGIMFLGTPHGGSALAQWAEMLARSMGFIKQTNADIVRTLKEDSEVLARIQGSFHTMLRARAEAGLPNIPITCFFEELPLPGVGLVVPKHSATIPQYISISIHANHMSMARFDSADDPGFVSLCGELRRWNKTLRPLAPREGHVASAAVGRHGLGSEEVNRHHELGSEEVDRHHELGSEEVDRHHELGNEGSVRSGTGSSQRCTS